MDIIMLIILAVGTLAWTANTVMRMYYEYKERAAQKRDQIIFDVAEFQSAIDRLLTTLNISGHWEQRDNVHSVHYDYQGGHFNININTDHPICRLTFLFFASMPIEKIDTVRIVTNKCNLSTDRCRLLYTVNDEKATVDMHIMSSFLLTGNTCASELSMLMDEIFAWGKFFLDSINQQDAQAKAGANLPDPEKWAADDAFITALTNEQEIAQSPIPASTSYSVQHPFTVGTLMESAIGLHTWQPVSITANDADLSGIAAPDIVRYDILEQAPDNADGQRLLTLTFLDAAQRTRRLVIHIQPENVPGKSTDTRYFRISTLLMPASHNNSQNDEPSYAQPEAVSFIVALDSTTPEQTLAKMRYLYKEATEAYRQGRPMPQDNDGLTVTFHPDQEVFNALYWGQSLFHAKRYAECIAPLTFVFRILNDELYADNKQHINALYRTCQMLGFSHSILGQHIESIYYLETLSISTRRDNDIIQFIRAMIANNDLRLLPYLTSLQEEIDAWKQKCRMENVNDEDNEDDYTQNTDREMTSYKLLEGEVLLAKAHVLTDRNQLDEASAVLEQLKQYPHLLERRQYEQKRWQYRLKASQKPQQDTRPTLDGNGQHNDEP